MNNEFTSFLMNTIKDIKKSELEIYEAEKRIAIIKQHVILLPLMWLAKYRINKIRKENAEALNICRQLLLKKGTEVYDSLE